MYWLQKRIPPPFVMLLTALAMGLAGSGSPSPIISGWLPTTVAAALALAAVWFGSSAIRAFRRANTTIDPVHVERASALVTSGIFARSRNPMYVAMALLLAAGAAWLCQPAPLLGPLTFVMFISRFQIVPEERALASLFGAYYVAYNRRVPRWL